MSGAELPLAIAGLVLAGPSIIDSLDKLRKWIAARINNLPAGSELYKNLSAINQSQTFEVMAFMATLESQLSEALRNELRILLQQLRVMYEELAAELPQSISAKISSRRCNKIREIVSRVEEWNDRYMKRVIVFLFFGQASHIAGNDEVERVIQSSKVLEKVNKLRAAVQTAFSSEPPGRLLLDASEIPEIRAKLPNSNLFLGQKDTQRSLVEYRTYSEDSHATVIQNIRRTTQAIAIQLRKADSNTMGILSCRGFFWDRPNNRLELHFPFPHGLENPRSLLDLLNENEANPKIGRAHPLNDRLNLAKRVAAALFYVHSGDFVHKNIRSENIIIFEKTVDAADPLKKTHQYPRTIGHPFLVGYDGVRRVDAASQLFPEEDWQKHIYLSPARHRLQKGDEFKPKHDVYSLGVVLLEIALWRTFTSRSGRGKILWNGDSLKAPEEMKAELLNFAKRNVPQVMGQRYAGTVVACLEELREDEEKGVLVDEDQLIPAPAYVTAIIKRLEEICI